MWDHYVRDCTRGDEEDLQTILSHGGVTLTIAGMYLGENESSFVFAQEVDNWNAGEDFQYETFYVLKHSIIKVSSPITFD